MIRLPDRAIPVQRICFLDTLGLKLDNYLTSISIRLTHLCNGVYPLLTLACTCGRKLQFIDDDAGKEIKCPSCGKTSLAPQAPAKISGLAAGSLPSGEEETLTKDAAAEDEVPPHEFLRPAQSADEIGRLGHFRILNELGRGGMGAVYLAEDVRLLRQVALKVMLPKFASHAKSKVRFLREARTAASIENDHIIAIFEVDEDNGIPFLTMPVLKGESLHTRLHRDTSLSAGEVLRIGWQICQGLQVAHDRDLVHRDLKPANLWLEGTRGRVKILDFGLARTVHTDQQLTQSGAIVGTPAYMAPEQARNPKVDGRADLFSLGIVLYRCLVGHAPFTGHDAMSVMLSICQDEPVPPIEHVSDIPVELSNLIMKLLQKVPDRRFASAEETGFALEAIDRKYFLGQAIPGSSLPPSTMQSIPIAQPVTLTTLAPAVETTMAASKPQPAAETNPFAFGEPPATMRSAPPATKRPAPSGPPVVPAQSRDKRPESEAATLAPTAIRGFPKNGIFILIGLGLLALVPILVWQIVIRLTDDKGNVREIPVKPGEKIVIVQNPKKTDPPVAGQGSGLPPLKPFAYKPIPIGQSPLDKLDAMAIPKEERFDWQPKELVAVIGNHARRHWNLIADAAISPDGKYACSSSHLDLIVWDMATQQPMATFKLVPSRVSFSEDSKTLHIFNIDGNHVIDMTKRPLVQTMTVNKLTEPGDWRGHRRIENGRTLVAWETGGQTRAILFDVSGKKSVVGDTIPCLSAHQSAFPSFYLASVGAAVYQSKDGKLHKVEIKNAKFVNDRELLIADGTGVPRGISADGKRIALWMKDHLELWDIVAEKPKRVLQFKKDDDFSGALALVISLDGRWLASANKMIGLWRIDGAEPKFVAWLDQTSRIGYVSFSGDGNRAVVGTYQGFVRFWDLAGETPTELSPLDVTRAFAPPDTLSRPQLDSRSGRLMLLTYDQPKFGKQRYQAWALDQPAPRPTPAPEAFCDTTVAAPVFPVGANRWLSMSAGGGQFYHLLDERWLPQGPAFGEEPKSYAVGDVAPDGRTMVQLRNTKAGMEFIGWDLANEPAVKWRVPFDGRRGNAGMAREVIMSADQRLCAAAIANDGKPGGEMLLLKNFDTKAELAAIIPLVIKDGLGHYRSALSPDGKYLAHLKRNMNEIVLEDLSKTAPLEVQKCSAGTQWLAFSPDGKRLAYASWGPEVGVLEVPTLKRLWTWKSPGPVNWCEWAADGRHLITHNGNKTAYVLRLSN